MEHRQEREGTQRGINTDGTRQFSGLRVASSSLDVTGSEGLKLSEKAHDAVTVAAEGVCW